MLAVTTGRLRADWLALIEALRGRVLPHHRFLLKLHLGQVEALEEAIVAVDAEVATKLEPFREQAQHLTTIPDKARATQRLVRCLMDLGYQVDLKAVASARSVSC